MDAGLVRYYVPLIMRGKRRYLHAIETSPLVNIDEESLDFSVDTLKKTERLVELDVFKEAIKDNDEIKRKVKNAKEREYRRMRKKDKEVGSYIKKGI